MGERKLVVITTGVKTDASKWPRASKKGDKHDDLVVLYRFDPERGAPIIIVGPPREERDF